MNAKTDMRHRPPILVAVALLILAGAVAMKAIARSIPCCGYVRDAELFQDHAGAGLL